MNYSLLEAAPLFRGITQMEIESMLICLNAREREYPKEALILRAGDTTHELGLVLSGSVSIESDDLWGNKTVLDHIGPGGVFAEAYACIPDEALMVNVITIEPTAILFLNIGKVLEVCQKTCAYHTKLIRNLLSIAAQKI